MRAGEWLARLNPSTMRLDGVRGGAPERTAQDIAAAVAMVPPGLGRELMLRLWWPEGAALSPRELDRLFAEAQLAEWRQRADALINGQLALALADRPALRARARALHEAARTRMWPRLGPQACYASIRQAVLTELSASGRCPRCGGRGTLRVGAVLRNCPDCGGTGRQRVSDRQRAAWIQRDVAAYTRIWRPVYDWTMQHGLDALAPAERALCRRLR